MEIIDKTHYHTVVYISHAYKGKQKNIDDVEHIIKKLMKQYPAYLFVSPIHAFGWLYDTVDYKTGLDMTLFLLENCADEMWVFGDGWNKSKGVIAEINYCAKRNIPYKIFNDIPKVEDDKGVKKK